MYEELAKAENEPLLDQFSQFVESKRAAVHRSARTEEEKARLDGVLTSLKERAISEFNEMLEAVSWATNVYLYAAYASPFERFLQEAREELDSLQIP